MPSPGDEIVTHHEFVVRSTSRMRSDGNADHDVMRVDETHDHLREQLQKAADKLIGSSESKVTSDGCSTE